MSRIIKRSGRALLWAAALLAVVALLGTLAMTGRAQQGGEPTDELPPMDVVRYAQVQALREDLGLRSADLAAMGLQDAQVETVLATLKGWTEANAASIQRVDTAQRASAAALHEGWRRFHVGGEEGRGVQTALATLERDAAAAAAERERLLSTAASAVNAVVPASARGVWQATRANRDLGAPYRFASLSVEQKAKLREALRRGDQVAARRELAGQAGAAMDLAQSRVDTRLESVVGVEASVLPLPEEYREEREPRRLSGTLLP